MESLMCKSLVENGPMAFTGESALTLHIYENKSIMETIGMTLSLSSRPLGLIWSMPGMGFQKFEAEEVGLGVELLQAY